MYDELVKMLRVCVDSNNSCGNCPVRENDGSCPHGEWEFAAEKYMLQAADAIEELQKAVYFHKYNSEFWEDKYNSLADEKWIPVTERLPKEADGTVFVLMPDVFPYNSKQPFVNCNQDRRIDMAHYSEHSKTWYFGDCGAVGGQEPIAWIHRSALPEPPKEDKP